MDQLGGSEATGSARAGGALQALLRPELEPMMSRPSRLGVPSAWYGHLPFARWVVSAARPRVIVELGTHAGVSYAAFCDAVLAEGLDARCFAVDTWTGDEHAGFYDESVFENFRAFHDARYGGFSRLLRCSFEEALDGIADGTVDLLHIDGRHRYEDVAADFASWRPKLSARAVVLLHDTNVRERDFGVWRFWELQSAVHPAFEFLHGHGLGVLLVGGEAPEEVAALCRMRDERAIATVRERFALLGERWELMHRVCELSERAAGVASHETAMATCRAEHAALRDRTAELEASNRAMSFQLAELRNERVVLLERVAANTSSAEQPDVTGGREAPETAAVAAKQDEPEKPEEAEKLDNAEERAPAGEPEEAPPVASDANNELTERPEPPSVPRAGPGILPKRILGRIRSLRVAAPEEAPTPTGLELIPPELEEVPSPQPELPAPAAEILTSEADIPALEPESFRAEREIPADSRPRILFISGEPETPGHHYRVLRAVALAEAAGWRADWSELPPVGPHTLAGARIVVLWRVPWSVHLQGILDACKDIGADLWFDVDDLVFRPELARAEIIDGIRTTGVPESATGAFFALMCQTLVNCQIVTCTTEVLAQEVRRLGAAATVLPNGFDQDTLARSRLAARARRMGERLAGDDTRGRAVRLGYAGGSRTHQRDFAAIAAPLATVLRARPEARLTLFRDPVGGEGVVLLREFPILDEVADQIEWRDMVPLTALPGELARFDINLAPLETGNAFCEAKSELKYFEAALAGVVTVASPTEPMRQAIRHGETGFLVDSEAAWEASLLALIDAPDLRRAAAERAYHHVLWHFGPQRRGETLRALLSEFEGSAAAARDFELTLRRAGHAAPNLPHVPEAATLFFSDALAEAAVSVVIPLYNYADYVLDALESVRTQALDRLDLVVIDDASTDDSAAVALEWMRRHANRFNRLVLLRHAANAGLGFARNSGFAAAETPYVLPLDADNRLLPDCCAMLAESLTANPQAAFAHPMLRTFGERSEVMAPVRVTPSRIVSGNYIDAMALVAKWAWAAAGGYDHVRHGWEDYDFWCRLIEQGYWGEHTPKVLAEYRVHRASMLSRSTEVLANKRELVADMHLRHPWLRIPEPR